MSEPLQSGNFPEGGIPELTLPKVGFPTPNPFDIQVKLMDPPPEEVILSDPCSFGDILISVVGLSTTYKVRGGAVTAGPNVWDVLNFTIDTASDGYFVVWVETDITGYSEDDLLLPGIASSTQSILDMDTSYPSQTIPTVGSSFEGTSIVPIGTIDIVDGVPSFYPSGCGDIIISHCPGSLSYSRV